MAGFCDETQNWCLSLGLWNGVDPILKERMFGLAGPQGNHGEDVKEYWWYLDGTPTHSWNTWRYHYPQREFPYGDLVAENARRGRTRAGVRAGRHRHLRRRAVTGSSLSTTPRPAPRDLLMRITVENAGPEEATLDVLPTLWFRNTWSWGYRDHPKPTLRLDGDRIVGEPLADPGRWCWSGTASPSRCSARTRRTTPRLFGAHERHAVPEGRHQRPCACTGRRRSTRTERGHQGGAALPVTVPAGGRDHQGPDGRRAASGVDVDPRSQRRADRPRRGFDAVVARAARRRRTRSTPR